MTDSQNLLAEFRQTGSDAAFRELVTRYVDLVYSTALRLVDGDAHRAQDVTQTVFLNLAKKVQTLPADVSLGGWLHRDTCLTAGHVMRGERRRQSRERQAAEMNALQNHSEADYSHVAPLLDEAINELGEADRSAILLRFFEQHEFRAVGQALGSNEDAARMRVNRALVKLEDFLKRRGITTTAASLGVVLTANAVQAAPVGLAVTISTAAALTGTTLATTTTGTAIKTIAMTTLQKTLITATLAIVAGVGIYEARQSSQLRGEIQKLSAQNEELSKPKDNPLPTADESQEEKERREKDKLELLRLRGEVGLLRRQTKEMEKLQQINRQLSESIAKLEQASEQTPPEEETNPFRQAAIVRMNNAKQLVLGLMMYADDNQNRIPTDLNMTSNYLGSAFPDIINTNQFEMVILGSYKSITNPMMTIAVREREATIVDGKRVKTYGFADGHAEFKAEPPEGFDAWEKQRMIPPKTEAH